MQKVTFAELEVPSSESDFDEEVPDPKLCLARESVDSRRVVSISIEGLGCRTGAGP